MRLSCVRWWIALPLVLLPVAACAQETTYPLIQRPPADGGLGLLGAGGSSTTSSSTGTTGPADGGADACSLVATVCLPVPDAGPDASCPPSGTVTGSLAGEAGACAAELISLGGAATAAGCCSSVCLPEGCKP